MAKNPWEEDYGVAKAPWEENYGEYKSEPQKEATIGSQFIGGAKQVGADVGTFLKSLTSPNVAAEEAVKKQEEIQKEVGHVRGLSDVTGVYKQNGILSAAGEMASQAPGAIAASTPQMLTAIAGNVAGAATGSAVVPGIGTVVGGYFGGALALFPQFYAENLAEQAQSQQEKGQKVDVNRAKAALAAAGQAGRRKLFRRVTKGRWAACGAGQIVRFSAGRKFVRLLNDVELRHVLLLIPKDNQPPAAITTIHHNG